MQILSLLVDLGFLHFKFLPKDVNLLTYIYNKLVVQSCLQVVSQKLLEDCLFRSSEILVAIFVNFVQQPSEV